MMMIVEQILVQETTCAWTAFNSGVEFYTLIASVEEVCGSVDVRNSPTNLERLKDCVVVEGFVHILLIDKYTEASFENYTFPLLTEITEYLLLFRVNGLRTLQKLFPNLTVIRGKKLVTNYAIVIYELMHIEEVGLSSLMYIQRGGVRIEKNPKLCFANTVDWDAIAPQKWNLPRRTHAFLAYYD
ncbi:hypothetical protein pipiens_010885 [Culex pipiens pipiens]|uniref:Receptor L-domain domain-containing protein n=1 Tax=Culex pipiens pipiens TaxID=38569 RepID=A0ABD1D8E3_CULPP